MIQHLSKTPCPNVVPKEKLALDPNYYPPNYVPEEEDAPLIVDNLVTPPEKVLKEESRGQEEKEEEVDEKKDRRKDSVKTQGRLGTRGR